jgi:hypothetical protein
MFSSRSAVDQVDEPNVVVRVKSGSVWRRVWDWTVFNRLLISSPTVPGYENVLYLDG